MIYALVHISLYAIENTECLRILMDNKIVEGLKKCIDASTNYSEVQILILDVSLNLLKSGDTLKKITGENPSIEKMIESKLADAIEDLQDVRNKTVNSKAYNIIMEFFNGEENDLY